VADLFGYIFALGSVYLELNDQIPTWNGYVTETNEALSNATGSSTNTIMLGNAQQSKASLFYVVKYISKNKVKIQQALLALEKAQQHIEKFPSHAPDADTDTTKRTVQHLFSRTLNQLYSHVEVSDTQVALFLLGMGTEVTSDCFGYHGAIQPL
jgi:hypothetical protein